MPPRSPEPPERSRRLAVPAGPPLPRGVSARLPAVPQRAAGKRARHARRKSMKREAWSFRSFVQQSPQLLEIEAVIPGAIVAQHVADGAAAIDQNGHRQVIDLIGPAHDLPRVEIGRA